jgi:zinc/manganese transport system substrate-binding protein
MSSKKIVFLLLMSMIPGLAFAKLNVVTTTEDLGSLAKEVGGDLVQVDSIGKGYMDPHFIDAKPSYLLKMKKADLFVEVGLELEVGWAPSLLTSARNPKILPGSAGFLEAGKGIQVVQKVSGQVDRSMGDVHPFGNPHYWLDPNNGLVMAKEIADKLAALDPANAAAFGQNYAAFETKLKAKDKEWLSTLAPYKGARVVTYHNSWPYFAQHFGIDIAGFVELRPGIPPSPSHVRDITEKIKSEKIPVVLVEPYFDTKLPQKIATDAGAKMLIFAPSVGAEPDIKTYLDLFDHDIKLLTDALGGKK